MAVLRRMTFLFTFLLYTLRTAKMFDYHTPSWNFAKLSLTLGSVSRVANCLVLLIFYKYYLSYVFFLAYNNYKSKHMNNKLFQSWLLVLPVNSAIFFISFLGVYCQDHHSSSWNHPRPTSAAVHLECLALTFCSHADTVTCEGKVTFHCK